MSKSSFPFVIGCTALVAAASAHAIPAPAGAADGCAPGKPSVIVHLDGFKQATGRVKLSLYGSDSRRWLAKGGKITKVKIPVTSKSMDVCLPVPAPGRYAVAVHHDLNTNGQRDRHDDPDDDVSDGALMTARSELLDDEVCRGDEEHRDGPPARPARTCG